MGTIAERVGVSRATVSNAYNRPDQLSAELQARIMEVAAALGYPGPDPVGRMLRRRTAGAIGLVQPSLRFALTDPANLMLLDGVAEECEAAGLALVLVPATTPTEEFVDVLASAAIDGVVAHCDSLDEARRAIVRSRQLPIVVLDGEGCLFVVGEKSEAEIENLDNALFVHQQVGGLHVAVNQTFFVSVRETFGRLGDVIAGEL